MDDAGFDRSGMRRVSDGVFLKAELSVSDVAGEGLSPFILPLKDSLMLLPRPLALFGRALLRRCPNCGGRPIFDGWFRMRDRCPRCGTRAAPRGGGLPGRGVHVQHRRGRADLRRAVRRGAGGHLARPALEPAAVRRHGADDRGTGRLLSLLQDHLSGVRPALPAGAARRAAAAGPTAACEFARFTRRLLSPGTRIAPCRPVRLQSEGPMSRALAAAGWSFVALCGLILASHRDIPRTSPEEASRPIPRPLTRATPARGSPRSSPSATRSKSRYSSSGVRRPPTRTVPATPRPATRSPGRSTGPAR